MEGDDTSATHDILGMPFGWVPGSLWLTTWPRFWGGARVGWRHTVIIGEAGCGRSCRRRCRVTSWEVGGAVCTSWLGLRAGRCCTGLWRSSDWWLGGAGGWGWAWGMCCSRSRECHGIGWRGGCFALQDRDDLPQMCSIAEGEAVRAMQLYQVLPVGPHFPHNTCLIPSPWWIARLVLDSYQVSTT